MEEVLHWRCVACGTVGEIERPRDAWHAIHLTDEAHAAASPECESIEQFPIPEADRNRPIGNVLTGGRMFIFARLYRAWVFRSTHKCSPTINSVQWVAVTNGDAPNEWKRGLKHKTTVWITVEVAKGLYITDLAYYNMHQSRWFWPWGSSENHVIADVIAWAPYIKPEPYKPEIKK